MIATDKVTTLTTMWKRSRFDKAATLQEYLVLVAARFKKFYGELIEPTVDGVYNALYSKGIIK